jgi:signal peptidase I
MTLLHDAAPAPAAPLRIPAAEQRRVRGRRRTSRLLASAVLAAVVLVVAAATAGVATGLWRFSVVDTGSMRPTLNPGDVAVLTSEPTRDLHRGQIVAFHPPHEPGLTVLHRVVALERRGAATIIETKGDANNAKDQWRARLLDATVWHESAKLPLVGYAVVWCSERLVRLGVLIVIVVLIVGLLLDSIWRPRPR